MPGDWRLISASRHWCFLGQITSHDFLTRLVLHVRDRAGRKLIVAFYTPDEGASIRASCQEGHTVAVLYPHQHTFLDGSVGIRLEDNKNVQVYCVVCICSIPALPARE